MDGSKYKKQVTTSVLAGWYITPYPNDVTVKLSFKKIDVTFDFAHVSTYKIHMKGVKRILCDTGTIIIASEQWFISSFLCLISSKFCCDSKSSHVPSRELCVIHKSVQSFSLNYIKCEGWDWGSQGRKNACRSDCSVFHDFLSMGYET